MKITFLGAVEEVTGSRYLVETEDRRILVDSGLFQGAQEHSIRNWDPFPVEPKSIDALILTHAHIDHTGYIPLLVKNGFKGKIYCSKATYELCALLLVDSAQLFEEDAKNAHKNADTDHVSVLPLYTKVDAQHALTFFHVVDFNTTFNIGAFLKITLIYSGHILGSSFVIISDGKQTLTFSGDLGRPHQLMLKPPPHLKHTDFLVLESTYGDRLHEQGDPIKSLAEVINKTVAKGGILVIPSFAVGRSQELLYCLYQLRQTKRIANIPIFLDSPMATGVTDMFCKFKDEYTLSPSICKDMLTVATYTHTVEESKSIYGTKPPMVIIAGGGMADGGRVLHHFEHCISDPKNTIAFVGFQAKGTHGRALVEGAQQLDIYGRMFKVRAQITSIDTLSAHADYKEILEWLGYFESSPKKLFLTHGELESSRSLKAKIEERFGWVVVIPKYLDSFDLD